MGIVGLIVQRGNRPVSAAYCTDAQDLSLSSSSLSRAEIISHCVWLYFRFTLSFRVVSGIVADAFGLVWAVIAVGALTFGSGIIVAASMRETRTTRVFK
jgi:hypothetical protein